MDDNVRACQVLVNEVLDQIFWNQRNQHSSSNTSRRDAQPLIPGKPAELKFCMWPTSILLRKGHAIRVALAGADVAVFRRYPPEGDATWMVYRRRTLASYVELPMRPR
jgi:predicted acyl esterase